MYAQTTIKWDSVHTIDAKCVCVTCIHKLSAQYLCVYLTKCTNKQYTLRICCTGCVQYANSTQYECCTKCVQYTNSTQYEFCTIHKQYTVGTNCVEYTNSTQYELCTIHKQYTIRIVYSTQTVHSTNCVQYTNSTQYELCTIHKQYTVRIVYSTQTNTQGDLLRAFFLTTHSVDNVVNLEDGSHTLGGQGDGTGGD